MENLYQRYLTTCTLLNASPYATCIGRENLKASRPSFYLSQYFFYQSRPSRYIECSCRCAVALLSWFPNVSPGAPTHWPPTSTTSGRLADGPGITKIRGSMIYNGVMGAWDDTALLLLPAGIIAGGWPRHCPGASQREIDSSKIERETAYFLLISLSSFLLERWINIIRRLHVCERAKISSCNPMRPSDLINIPFARTSYLIIQGKAIIITTLNISSRNKGIILTIRWGCGESSRLQNVSEIMTVGISAITDQ